MDLAAGCETRSMRLAFVGGQESQDWDWNSSTSVIVESAAGAMSEDDIVVISMVSKDLWVLGCSMCRRRE